MKIFLREYAKAVLVVASVFGGPRWPSRFRNSMLWPAGQCGNYLT
ncbi:unnamed protein product [Gemmata massiliana]|uniref:Uncharacterized protein n=1 Tax=Gemmata massiliana TaxID=1210884 RepID=A0A6P2D3D0_9BACT|nr:unnamed protein product [Gemmata massiliana]